MFLYFVLLQCKMQAGRLRYGGYSHSIVAGGLLEMS